MESAELCVMIMAVLCQKTDQIPAELRDAGERSLNRNLVDAYLDAIDRLNCNADWLPGDESVDPWRYRVSTYDMAQEKSLIIRP
jgi:hypothetical protein